MNCLYTIRIELLLFFLYAVTYLVRFLSEEEALIELGLVEAAADQGDGTVISSTVILSPQLQQDCLSCHVLSEGLKTQSDIYCIDQKFYFIMAFLQFAPEFPRLKKCSCEGKWKLKFLKHR